MDKEWLTRYYRGLGYNERRIVQMLKNSEVIEKEKEAEVKRYSEVWRRQNG